MKERLNDIFRWLECDDNREYNRKVQTTFFRSVFENKTSYKDKLISLLYFVAETQSQPNIKLLSQTYRRFYNEDKIRYNSFEAFCSSIGCKSPSYLDLSNQINTFPGFGDKTSALFSRMIFQIHHLEHFEEFKIWDNVPTLTQSDTLFLPVDAVIVDIFKHIQNTNIGRTGKPLQWNFVQINKVLHEDFKIFDMEVWDDLWFWGFISQKVIKEKKDKKIGPNGQLIDRELIWNKDKYWTIQETDKSQNTIDELANKKVNDFISLLIN